MYLKTRLQITSSNGAEDAHDRLENMSMYNHVYVVIGGHTYEADVLDYEALDKDPMEIRPRDDKNDDNPGIGTMEDRYPHDEHVGLDLPGGYGSLCQAESFGNTSTSFSGEYPKTTSSLSFFQSKTGRRSLRTCATTRTPKTKVQPSRKS